MDIQDLALRKKVKGSVRTHWAFIRETFSKEEFCQKYFSSEGEKLAIKAVIRNIKLLSPYLPDKDKSEFKILDVGMGTGKLPVVLKSLGYDVYGLDDDGGGTQTSEFLQRLFPMLKVEVCPLELACFPHKDNQFDLVTSLDVIEHLPGSPKHFLQEIYRIMKPGGILFLSNPNPASLSNLIKTFVGKSVYHPLEKWFDLASTGNYQGHWREYTVSELAYMVNKAGFGVVKKGCRPLLIDFSKYSFGFRIPLVFYGLLTSLVTWMGNDAFVICTKPRD